MCLVGGAAVEQRLALNLEDEAAAEVVHVVLREVEPCVLAEVVGRLAHEDSAVVAVALLRDAVAPRSPRVIGPARVVPRDFALVDRLVLQVVS